MAFAKALHSLSSAVGLFVVSMSASVTFIMAVSPLNGVTLAVPRNGAWSGRLSCSGGIGL